MDNEPLGQKQYWLQQQFNGAILFIVFATLLVGLNLVALYIRKKRRGVQLGWNNVLILASFTIFLLHCASTIVNAHAYKRFYKTESTAQQLAYSVTIRKSTYAMSVTYPIAFTLPKLAVCMLYLQVFSVHHRTRQITLSLIAFLTVNCIAWLVPSVTVCHPISAFWNPEEHQSKCINYNIFGTWISLPNIASDLVMLVLPMPLLWKMHASVARRFGLIITFAAGCGGIVGGCLRLGFYVHRTYIERPGTNQTTRSIAVDNMVSYIECGMYLIAACLPVLPVIFTHLRDLLGKSIESFLERYRNENSSGPQIDFKLTGIGNLNTLQRRGNQVGLSIPESVLNQKIPCSMASA